MQLKTVLLPIISSILMWYAWPYLPLATTDADLRGVTTAIIGTDATMLGFLVSAGALVYAIAQTQLIRNLYRTGHLRRLLVALFVDATLFFVALCSSVLCLLTVPNLFYVKLLVTLNAAALAALIPVGYTMWHLLIAAGPENNNLEFK